MLLYVIFLAAASSVGLCLRAAPVAAQGAADPAAPAPAHLSITTIDGATYPQVRVTTAIVDTNGNPLASLAPDQVVVSEDGTQVLSSTLTVGTARVEPLSVLLVMDRSTTPGNWAALQAAASSFLEGLGAGDQAGLVVYGDDAELVQPLTADHKAVSTTLALVTPGGNLSALNLAVQTGLDSLMAAAPGGSRQAIVVLADRLDNTYVAGTAQGPAPDALVAAAEAGDIAIHMLGYGPNIGAAPPAAAGEQPDPDTLLTNPPVIAATGGRVTMAPNVAGVADSLAGALAALRQGLSIDFASQAAAGAEHTIAVSIPAAGLSATRTYTAAQVPVQVTITNLTDTQQVAGNVLTTLQMTATAPVSRVTFLLDGTTVITSIEGSAAGIIWDSRPGGQFIDKAGLHTFTVRVEDAAGNGGESSVRLDVVDPLTLQVRAPAGEIPVTATAAITVDLYSYFGNAQLDVLLGDRWLTTTLNPEPGLSVVFSAAGLAPTVYPISVRARDGQGNTVVDNSQTVAIVGPLAAPTPAAVRAAAQPRSERPASGGFMEQMGAWYAAAVASAAAAAAAFWAHITAMPLQQKIVAAVAAVTFFLIVILLWAFIKGRRKQSEVPQILPAASLHISNEGNVALPFRLRAENPEAVAGLRLTVNGSDLAELAAQAQAAAAAVALPASAVLALAPVSVPAAGQNGTPNGAQGGAQYGVNPADLNQKAAQAAAAGQQAAEKAQQAGAIAVMIGDLLRNIGRLLPQGLRGPVLNLSNAISTGSRTVSSAQAKAKQSQMMVNAAGQSAKSLSQATGISPGQAAAGNAADQQQAAAGQQAAASAPPGEAPSRAGNQPATTIVLSTAPDTGWQTTPPLDPGTSLRVDVQMNALVPARQDRQATLRLYWHPADEPVAEDGGQAAQSTIQVTVPGRDASKAARRAR